MSVHFQGPVTGFYIYKKVDDLEKEIRKVQEQQAFLQKQITLQQQNQSRFPMSDRSVQPMRPYVNGSTVRFSGDPISSWVIKVAADKAVEGTSLTAGPERYAKVDQFSKCPKALLDGDIYLQTAKNADNKKEYYTWAEKRFIDAVNESTVKTVKSHAFRRAAIAAKLKGDNGAAKNYMEQAKMEKFEAGDGQDQSYVKVWGPEGDIRRLREACRDGYIKTTTFFKALALTPVWLVEQPLRWLNGEDDTKVSDFIYEKTCPFEAHIDKAQNTLKARFKELEGESSDEEWLHDNDRVRRGTSTGKGLRHQYLRK